MSTPARSPIRFADKVIGASQFAAQFFGLLPDGREGVDVKVEGDALVVTLPDRSSDGWAPVSARIPARFEFFQCTTSVLTRTALFRTVGTKQDARTWFASAGITFPKDSDCVRLSNGAVLKLGSYKESVDITFKQVRDEAALASAIIDRVSPMNESS